MLTSRRTIVAYSLACAAGLSTAFGQNTQVIFEASRDGGLTWSNRVDAFLGDDILVHARIRLIGVGTITVLGLAGITFQPRLTNWNSATDLRLPFSSSDGSAVPRDQPDALGRVYPFASSSMNSSSASGLLTSHAGPGNILRFAGANATTPSTNLAWGVSSGQLPLQIGGTNFRSGTDVVVFRYAVRLGGDSPRALVATVPLTNILQQRGNWYRGFDPNLAPVTQDTILPATIHYIPSASPTLTLLAALSILTPRRRRS